VGKETRLAADHVAVRLKALSEETARLASALSSDGDEGGRGARRERSGEEVLEALVGLRRLRRRSFGEPFASGPVWDMLLDLMAARLAGRRLSVSSLCAGVDASTTTALRWIGALVEEGLASREADPDDRRRTFIDLTPEGERRMRAYVHKAQRFFD
jgi:DNA-binding MarR family transcriptional regulator